MGRETLGEFELMALPAAIRLGEDWAHAVAIVDDGEARAGRAPRRAAVHVTLRRLQDEGPEAARTSMDALENMWQGIPALQTGAR